MKTIKFRDDGFKSCCFTGYRPSKFPFSLKKGDIRYTEFENRLTDAILSLCERGCYTFYSGVAMGFDIIAAETVLQIREAYNKAAIRLVCAVPFKDQASTFSEDWRNRYKDVLLKADETIVLSDDYYRGCYNRRNEFMVDSSEFVLTWFDGRAGGTGNTLAYARRKRKEIINLYEGALNDYSYPYQYELIIEDE